MNVLMVFLVLLAVLLAFLIGFFCGVKGLLWYIATGKMDKELGLE